LNAVRKSIAALVAFAAVFGAWPANHDIRSDVESPRYVRTTPAAPSDDEVLRAAALRGLGEREGTVIIMDPQNGRLRAIVNPRLAYEQAFPPGSSIKPFTALAAMRAGLIDSRSRIMCAGRYVSPEFQIVCSHPVSRSPFNLAQALAYSCNYYFAETARRLSQGSFNSVLSAFGFGKRTGRENGTESAGAVPNRAWQMKSALGEGDQILVTPIQLSRAYAALVCDGQLYHPHSGSAGDFVPEPAAKLYVSDAERAVLVEGMRGAVVYGTASSAKLGSLPPYVFGKTGTSTASNGFRTQGWFVGFASNGGPAARPSLEVLVFLKRSHGADGAAVTRPIFEEFARMSGNQKGDQASLRTTPASPALGSPPAESFALASAPTLGRLVQTSQLALFNSADPPPGPPSRRGDEIKVHSVARNSTDTLPLEKYIIGVVTAESSTEDQPEALKAQAVISRTYALRNLGRHSAQGYDFCSTTHCQRYLAEGGKETAASRQAEKAVAETSGQVLLDGGGRLVDAYFHAICGGATADMESLWGVPSPPYLRGVRDDYCRNMPNATWTDTISLKDLSRALRTDPRTDPGRFIKSISITKHDRSGRAETIEVRGEHVRSVRGWDFKMTVGRILGWNVLKSSWFDIVRSGDSFIFHGRGFGHGLGMCQEGAHVMAKHGFRYTQILEHYFPATTVSRFDRNAYSESTGRAYFGQARTPPVPRASAPQQMEAGSKTLERAGATPVAMAYWSGPATRLVLSSEHFHASYHDPSQKALVGSALEILEAARGDLLGRLAQASVRFDEPDGGLDIVINHTTQDFMAATGQPWYAAAATRGATIQLQPLAVLQRKRILATTLRHEYAHFVIETISHDKAPRWLEEGLAMYFAGEGPLVAKYASKTQLAPDDLDRRLAAATTLEGMRTLYAACVSRVQHLVRSSGEAQVWRLLVNPTLAAA
jgi:stage II sporulation protein D